MTWKSLTTRAGGPSRRPSGGPRGDDPSGPPRGALGPGEDRLVLLVHEGRKLGRVVHVKEEDDKNGPVIVALERTATIAGRVVDPGGNPVSGATIRCKPLPGDNFHIMLPELASGRDGRFTIPDVPTGCGYTGVVYRGSIIQRQVAFENLTVRPGETTVVGDIRWKD